MLNTHEKASKGTCLSTSMRKFIKNDSSQSVSLFQRILRYIEDLARYLERLSSGPMEEMCFVLFVCFYISHNFACPENYHSTPSSPFLIAIIYFSLCMCLCVPMCACRNQTTTSTIWIPGMEVRLPGTASYWPLTC